MAVGVPGIVCFPTNIADFGVAALDYSVLALINRTFTSLVFAAYNDFGTDFP